MHQIQFWLGLHLRTRWGSLQRSPDPLAGFKGLLLREKRGMGGDGRGKGRGAKERGREEKGRGAYRDEGPLTKILNTPLVATG